MRPMPKIPKASDEVRMARLRISDAPIILRNMTGVKKTRKTIYNWCKLGRRAYSGERIFLEHETVAGELYTTKDALRRFLGEIEK